MSNGVSRRLSDVCQEPINFTQPVYRTCCTAALYYLYYAGERGGLGSFEIAMGGKNPELLIRDLTRAYGTGRTRWFLRKTTPLQVTQGSVLVLKDDLMVRHVCIAGGGNQLYCHNQAGWFSGCNHAQGSHCHHSSAEIRWTDNTHAWNGNYTCEVYTIPEDRALKWIKRNF
jgi:hypothetical protein